MHSARGDATGASWRLPTRVHHGLPWQPLDTGASVATAVHPFDPTCSVCGGGGGGADDVRRRRVCPGSFLRAPNCGDTTPGPVPVYRVPKKSAPQLSRRQQPCS